MQKKACGCSYFRKINSQIASILWVYKQFLVTYKKVLCPEKRITKWTMPKALTIPDWANKSLRRPRGLNQTQSLPTQCSTDVTQRLVNLYCWSERNVFFFKRN